MWTLCSLLINMTAVTDNIQFVEENRQLTQVREEVGQVVVGLSDLVDRLLVSLLCNGHVLIEGVPATGVTPVLANHYRFSFTQPPDGLINVTWAPGHVGKTAESFTVEGQLPDNGR